MILQVPIPNTIPGVPVNYFPTEGYQLIWAWNERMMEGSKLTMAVILLVALLLAAAAPLGQIKVTATQTFLRAFVAIVLLAAFNQIFAIPMAVTHAFAELVISQAEIDQLNDEFQKAGERDPNPILTQQQADSLPWFARLGYVAYQISPATAVLTELFMGIMTMIFLVVVGLSYLLWRFLVGIAFAMGPLCIVMGMVPGWGPRVLSGYLGAITQLGLLQIWNAGCAFMVMHADKFFRSHEQLELLVDSVAGSGYAMPNHLDAILYTFLFTCAYIMGWGMITLFFPYSKFTAFAAWTTGHSISFLTQSAVSTVMLPVRAASAAKGLGGK